MNNSRILFLLQLPNPIHGASLIGKYIKESKKINNDIFCYYINISTSNKLNDIGKNSLYKFIKFAKIFLKTLNHLVLHKPDLVYYAITAKGVGFYKDIPIILLIKLFQKKLVIHYHNKGVSLNQDKLIDDFFYKILFSKTKVILLSKKLFFDVKKYVYLKDVFYCANGIKEIKFKSLKNNKTGNKINILFLSNLIVEKGIFVLLDSLKILKSQNLDFNCNIVGGEADVKYLDLKKKIEQMNLESNVTILGKLYDEKKYQIFSDSDIFVFPTFYHNECFPLVLLEAMMFSLPIISTDEGAISEIVENNINGYIIDRNNSKQLANKIKYFIQNPEMIVTMGGKGNQKFTQNYKLEIFEKKLLNILKKII